MFDAKSLLNMVLGAAQQAGGQAGQAGGQAAGGLGGMLGQVLRDNRSAVGAEAALEPASGLELTHSRTALQPGKSRLTGQRGGTRCSAKGFAALGAVALEDRRAERFHPEAHRTTEAAAFSHPMPPNSPEKTLFYYLSTLQKQVLPLMQKKLSPLSQIWLSNLMMQQ